MMKIYLATDITLLIFEIFPGEEVSSDGIC